MQFLLSEEEYREIHRTKVQRTEEQKAELQTLCTLAAQHIPIVCKWDVSGKTHIWGCILGPEIQSPGYCDDCPARGVCPYEHKEFSN